MAPMFPQAFAAPEVAGRVLLPVRPAVRLGQVRMRRAADQLKSASSHPLCGASKNAVTFWLIFIFSHLYARAKSCVRIAGEHELAAAAYRAAAAPGVSLAGVEVLAVRAWLQAFAWECAGPSWLRVLNLWGVWCGRRCGGPVLATTARDQSQGQAVSQASTEEVRSCCSWDCCFGSQQLN